MELGREGRTSQGRGDGSSACFQLHSLHHPGETAPEHMGQLSLTAAPWRGEDSEVASREASRSAGRGGGSASKGTWGGAQGHQWDPCQPISSCHPGLEGDIDTGSNPGHRLLFCFGGREGLTLELQACANCKPRKGRAWNKIPATPCPTWPPPNPRERAEETDLTQPPEEADSCLCLQLCRGRRNGNGEPDAAAGEEGSAAEPQHCRPQVRKDIFS